MKAKWLPISAAVIMALGSASASAVEFHGYMRAGLGANTDGGSQYCYGTGGPNWHTVGRLGDECDTYAELALSQEVYNMDKLPLILWLRMVPKKVLLIHAETAGRV